MNVVLQPALRLVVRHYRQFRFVDNLMRGYTFDCDAEGVPTVSNDEALRRFQQCVQGEVEGRVILDRGVTTYSIHVAAPALGQCDECGATLSLEDYINTCACGAEYSPAGRRLRPAHNIAVGDSTD